MARLSKHVRLFRSAAAARLAEADFLRSGDHSLGAVYLGGYAVECALKALILSLLYEHEQPDVMADFRGRLAHDYGYLRNLYRERGGSPAPKQVSAAFATLSIWGTHLRYEPRIEHKGDVKAFFAALDVVLDWANERL